MMQDYCFWKGKPAATRLAALVAALLVPWLLPGSMARGQADGNQKEETFGALAEELDRTVPPLLAGGRIPGAVMAVGVRRGQAWERWSRAWGWAALEPDREPMRTDAIFDLASLTKPVAVGTALALLIDRGQVEIDRPVASYLPGFEFDGRERLTIRHLATHTSGAPAYLSGEEQANLIAKSGFPCREAVRQAIRDHRLPDPPGLEVRYSCLNAILLGEIVERVSGLDLPEFCGKEIFAPLGMTETCFNPPAALRGRCVPTTRSARGSGAGGFLRGDVHDPLAAMQGGVSGNAGLFSTAGDLGKLAEMLLDGGEVEGRQFLSAGTVRALLSVQNPGSADARGLLWDIYPASATDGKPPLLRAVGHTGYTGTAIWLYPDARLYVIALTNRVHPDDTGEVAAFRKAVRKSVEDWWQHTFGQPGTVPSG